MRTESNRDEMHPIIFFHQIRWLCLHEQRGDRVVHPKLRSDFCEGRLELFPGGIVVQCFKFGGSLKFGRWRIQQIFKNSVKTEKIQSKQNWIVKGTRKIWKPKIRPVWLNYRPVWPNYRPVFKTFWPIKKIWVNLNFNKLNDVVFEKYLHQSAQNLF
jgi:hypothetical protein